VRHILSPRDLRVEQRQVVGQPVAVRRGMVGIAMADEGSSVMCGQACRKQIASISPARL